jgi:hypothetical protein
MFKNKFISLTSSRITAKKLFNLTHRSITRSDLFQSNPQEDIHLKYDPIKNPKNQKKFEKEFTHGHWLNKWTRKVSDFFYAPFEMKYLEIDKDTELGKYQWNSNGAYQNRLSNILYRSEVLQNRYVMRFFMRFFEHRHALEMNRAEAPPQISPNSVFLYRDSSNSIVNRRAAERFGFFLLLTMAFNVPTALMYIYIAYYFHVLQKNYYTSQAMVYRMDLLPETEQLHVLKIGGMGFTYSELINIKDLIKIERDEEGTYPLRWYKTRLWLPMEDEFLLFKDANTQKVYTFNRKGIWNENGISHKLLN